MTRGVGGSQTLVLENQDVVIESGVIRQIGHTGTLTLPAEHTQISGAGKYLVPGLAEMRWALYLPLANFQDFPERYVNDVLFLYLAGGSDHGGVACWDIRTNYSWRNEIVAGELLGGPRCIWPVRVSRGGSVDGVSDVRRRVRNPSRRGLEALKKCTRASV